MNRREAIEFLERACKRNHDVVYTTAPPSYGNPGIVRFISYHCPCVLTDGCRITGFDETLRCECGATAHNKRVDEAIEALTKQTDK